MNGALLKPVEASALRSYGAWSESEWTPGSAGGSSVFTRRFTWTSPAVAVQHDQPLTLTYFADAVVDPKRMGDLTYLATRERHAIDTLEAMVLAAINGVGYLGLPHPGAEITQDVCALVGGWVSSRGHPEDWGQRIAATVGAAIDRLNVWQRLLSHVEAAPDIDHHPSWGMKVAIVPMEPKAE